MAELAATRCEYIHLRSRAASLRPTVAASAASLLPFSVIGNPQQPSSHFREEYQENGEALRDDEHFSYAAAWEWTGSPGAPRLHKEPLTFEYVKPSKRSYK